MSPTNPETWLETRPTIDLFPAIRNPPKQGFFERLFRKRPQTVPPVECLRLTPDGLIHQTGEYHTENGSVLRARGDGAAIAWSDPFVVHLSRDLDGGELGILVRHGSNSIGIRVLAPESWLGALDAPEKDEGFAFVAVEELGRIWNALAWHLDVGGRTPLPPWPDAIAFELTRESVDPPSRCEKCESYRVRYIGDEIFVCRACGHEGGEGVQRRAEAERRARLLAEDRETAFSSRWVRARSAMFTALDMLRLHNGYVEAGLVRVDIHADLANAREALEELAILYTETGRRDLAIKLRRIEKKLRRAGHEGSPNFYFVQGLASDIDVLGNEHASQMVPEGNEVHWANRAHAAGALSAVETARARAAGDRPQGEGPRYGSIREALEAAAKELRSIDTSDEHIDGYGEEQLAALIERLERDAAHPRPESRNFDALWDDVLRLHGKFMNSPLSAIITTNGL